MEIPGVECSHIECNARVWKDDPEYPKWLRVYMSSPGYQFEEEAHYCPAHGGGLVKNTKFDQGPTTGQERIVGQQVAIKEATEVKPFIDPALAQAMLDDANDTDLARLGPPDAPPDLTEVLEEFGALVADQTQPLPKMPKQEWEPARSGHVQEIVPINDTKNIPLAKSKERATARRPRVGKPRGTTVGRVTTALVFAISMFASLKGLK